VSFLLSPGLALGFIPLIGLSRFTLLGLPTISVAVPTFYGAYRHGENIKKLLSYMVLNVIIIILTQDLCKIHNFGQGQGKRSGTQMTKRLMNLTPVPSSGATWQAHRLGKRGRFAKVSTHVLVATGQFIG